MLIKEWSKGNRILLFHQEVAASHTPQGTIGLFPTDHWGNSRTIKRGLSTCVVGIKMVNRKASPSSLGKGLDWMRDTISEDLGNGLVGRWTQQKPAKVWEVDWLF